MTPPVVLTAAGTDSGGAAGVAADLATFAALGAHGACVVTAVTAQDTTGVHDVHPIPQATIDSQLDAVLDDLPVAAVKTGMLGTAAAVEGLSSRIAGLPDARRPAVVVDPVLVATSGSILGDASVRDAYVRHLLGVATVATPNLEEARSLAGAAGLDPTLSPARLAVALTEVCPAMVVTGGEDAVDWVSVRGSDPVPLEHLTVPTENDHGTGCTFSAALAVHLAQGLPLAAAAAAAAELTARQLDISRTWALGRGRGPIAHVAATSPLHDHHFTARTPIEETT